ncbi:hypothetical protein [Rhodoluna limnophila]|uniref:hypothetical protein n=1 Tax=Rhodoluna limnophila TaxID=232537 RepID=UPI001105BF7E|nr:hypothetical protein [Rhodoluna limnophila]
MKSEGAQQGTSFNRHPKLDQVVEAHARLGALFQDFDALVLEFSSTFQHRSMTSAIGLDDLALKPYLLTTEVQYALSSCIDHLQTIRNLTATDLIPNLAAYTLVRSALEHASLAMWFLDPDDPQERRRRVLVQAARGAKLLCNALEDIEISANPTLEVKLKKINNTVVSLGLSPITNSEIQTPGIKARVRWSGQVLQDLGVGSDGINLISTVWQSASGIAHANSSAGLMLLNRRALEDHDETSSTTFHISTSEVEIASLFQLSLYFLTTVVQLAKYRQGLASVKYPSFSKAL